MQLSAYLVAVCAFAASASAFAVDGNAEAAKDKISMCVGCHGIPGYKTAFPDVYHVPMLGGQHADYIIAALNAYKTGERSHPSMRAIAEGLTDQDIADLAAFYGVSAGGAQ